MTATASARFVRMAPRKTRLLVALVRGRSIAEARRQLSFSQKNAAEPVLKVLNSAVANATNNLKMDASTLVVAKAWVDEGPAFHRFTPRAQGRATPIRHRTSHIYITVGAAGEKTNGKAAVASVKKAPAKKATAAKAKKNA